MEEDATTFKEEKVEKVTEGEETHAKSLVRNRGNGET